MATAKKKAVKKKAVKKKAVKKAVKQTVKKAVKKKAAPKAVAKKAAVSKAKPAKKKRAMSDDEKRMMIALHAYYKWEQAGFPQGDDYKHWMEAEAEIDEMLD